MSETNSVQVYKETTRNILDNLLASSRLLRQQKQEEALTVLRGMRSAVNSLHKTALEYRDRARWEEELCEAQLEELVRQVGEIRDQEQDVERHIRDIQSQLERLGKNRERLLSDEVNLQASMAMLRKQIARLRARAEEMKKWFWVPGYGQYLAIRNLVDDDINRLKSKQEELGRLMVEISRDEAEIRDINRMLEGMTRDAQRLAAQEKELSLLRADLDKRKKHYARSVVFLLRIESFYSTLNQKLELVDRRIEDVQELLSVVEKFEEEISDLESALLNFADEVDKGAKIIAAA